jgi:hypothetical protein
MFPPVERMKLLIAFEASNDLLILDPFLLGTEGSLDYFLHLFVHQQIISFRDKINEYIAFI